MLTIPMILSARLRLPETESILDIRPIMGECGEIHVCFNHFTLPNYRGAWSYRKQYYPCFQSMCSFILGVRNPSISRFSQISIKRAFLDHYKGLLVNMQLFWRLNLLSHAPASHGTLKR